MTARTVEASGLSVPLHRCHGGFQASNGTCAEQLSLFPPFSSTLALLVLVAVLVGIILVSLATFHFHKRKLRNRKIQRAQEEYERDSRSPTRAGARGEPARPCVIVRPVRREEKLLVCQSAESAEGAASAESAEGAESAESAESAKSADVQAEDRRAPHETVPLDC
ncbi:uncharacterized protein C11orf87 homolog [Oryzias melastigma]|uniref:uncharacterized protein C11orf87 homolog n=1 Tax=Oryzias melastigma TaxID=30732 RepID=UPI000CF7DCA3|nr:uncharacterized protein C11orf87 homolog [Oryzias melastigma]